MKILNLYAGIGGNRQLWNGHEVTAVEYREDISAVYRHYFPDDALIVGDAHQYLLDHYREFDFIWAHLHARHTAGLGCGDLGTATR
jgi:DNA (cytosine-5)-methyltransferase 1